MLILGSSSLPQKKSTGKREPRPKTLQGNRLYLRESQTRQSAAWRESEEKSRVCLTVTPPLEDSHQDERRDLLSAKRKITAYDDITQETSQEETPYVETETLEEKNRCHIGKKEGKREA
jgi:hypothetical protein